MKTIDLPKVSETGIHRTMKKMGVSYSQALEAKEIVKHKRRTANRIISEELARGRSVESIINGPLTDLAAEMGRRANPFPAPGSMGHSIRCET